MTHAEYIVEKMLDDEELKGTGIFMKQLDSGRKVYSCKCPTCGNIHGGYRSYAEAERNLKCREHHRKEIEKTKKEIEKVDDPKKDKDLFKNPNKEMSFAEAEEDFGDDDWRDAAELAPDSIRYEIYSQNEYFPLSRDGLIGRQGWKINQMSGGWKMLGMDVWRYPGSRTEYIPWDALRKLLDKGENFTGHVHDLDHGTHRRWGAPSRIFALTVKENLQDELALLAGVPNL